MQMAELRALPGRPLSTGQVARRFGLSTMTVRRWIESGLLSALRTPNGHYRIPASELERIRAGLPMDATPTESISTNE